MHTKQEGFHYRDSILHHITPDQDYLYFFPL